MIVLLERSTTYPKMSESSIISFIWSYRSGILISDLLHILSLTLHNKTKFHQIPKQCHVIASLCSSIYIYNLIPAYNPPYNCIRVHSFVWSPLAIHFGWFVNSILLVVCLYSVFSLTSIFNTDVGVYFFLVDTDSEPSSLCRLSTWTQSIFSASFAHFTYPMMWYIE